MIPTKERDEIINLIIERLSSSDTEFPYAEIKQKYSVNESTLLTEILRELSNQGIIKESGNTFHSGKLISKGLEIKRNGGWLRTLEIVKLNEDRLRIKEETELENLRYSTKLSKIQIKWFHVSLIVGFVGGLAGILALTIELKEIWSKDKFQQNSKEKVQLPKPILDSATTIDVSKDSLKMSGAKNAR